MKRHAPAAKTVFLLGQRDPGPILSHRVVETTKKICVGQDLCKPEGHPLAFSYSTGVFFNSSFWPPTFCSAPLGLAPSYLCCPIRELKAAVRFPFWTSFFWGKKPCFLSISLYTTCFIAPTFSMALQMPVASAEGEREGQMNNWGSWGFGERFGLALRQSGMWPEPMSEGNSQGMPCAIWCADRRLGCPDDSR